MLIGSNVFEENMPIPMKYTCEGENINPPLYIKDVSPAAESLALLMSDPDAPGKTFYHWILYNMPPDISQIAEGETPIGALIGKNDFGEKKYGGPCPPSGTHRYFFKLYALNNMLALSSGEASMVVEHALQGQIIGTAEFMGTYQKIGKEKGGES